MICPFISNATAFELKNINHGTLFKLAQKCPYMKKKLNSYCSNNYANKVDSNPNGPIEPSQEQKFDYDVFCSTKIEEKKNSESYRVFNRINRLAECFPVGERCTSRASIAHMPEPNPEKVLVWCSNDYLGLSRHPRVISSAIEALNKYGVGSGGTRNISGNQVLHEKLEHRLAKWYRKDAGLLFTSCYVANVTTLYTLAKLIPNCVIISDEANHASMIEGIRNSRVQKHIYHHNNPEHLEDILKKMEVNIPKIVAFESLNSMNGSIAPVKQLCDIAHKYGALTFIDEVHAVGLYGFNGSGIGEELNCLEDMDIISGTLGKTVGSLGGFIVGNKSVIDFVRSYGSGLIFTTSLPPVLLASSITSIDILSAKEGRELRHEHKNVVNNLRMQLIKNGFPIFDSQSHILPVHVGDAKTCREISNNMLDKFNVYVQAINYPTVKQGTERLRIAPTPLHTQDHIEKLLLSLLNSWKTVEKPLLHETCHNLKCDCKTRCKSFSQNLDLIGYPINSM